jgi:hypothetical protein
MQLECDESVEPIQSATSPANLSRAPHEERQTLAYVLSLLQDDWLDVERTQTSQGSSVSEICASNSSALRPEKNEHW